MKIKDKNSALLHLVLALCFGVIITCVFSAYAGETEKSIADSLIRLHVIANSDTKEDQSLKLKVRDAIVNEVGTLFADNKTIDETRAELTASMSRIKEIAKAVIRENGYGYDVSLHLGNSDFPTKVYGSVTLPAGTYEALRVVIGQGAGQNWWCVLFPPLCFVDAATAEMTEAGTELLKSSMTDEEYQMVTGNGKLPLQVKFKAYEMWQSSRMKLKTMIARN